MPLRKYLLLTIRQKEEVMVVGAVRDPETGQLTYGGNRRVDPSLRPFLCTRVEPNGSPQDVDVVNGNIFFVPDSIARAIGNLDPIFEHGMGDTDYSMRARKPGTAYFADCWLCWLLFAQSSTGTHKDGALAMTGRLQKCSRARVCPGVHGLSCAGVTAGHCGPFILSGPIPKSFSAARDGLMKESSVHNYEELNLLQPDKRKGSFH